MTQDPDIRRDLANHENVPPPKRPWALDGTVFIDRGNKMGTPQTLGGGLRLIQGWVLGLGHPQKIWFLGDPKKANIFCIFGTPPPFLFDGYFFDFAEIFKEYFLGGERFHQQLLDQGYQQQNLGILAEINS